MLKAILFSATVLATLVAAAPAGAHVRGSDVRLPISEQPQPVTIPPLKIRWVQIAMDPNTLTTILTSAILVLAAVTILVAIFTIASVIFLRKWYLDKIDQLVEERANYIIREDVGRTRFFIGYVFGRLIKVDEQYLDDALIFSRGACDELPDTSPHIDVAMNNWAFYASQKGDPADAPGAMQIGKKLRDRYSSTQDRDDATTYASIVATYYARYDNPREAVNDALELMEEMVRDPSISEVDKGNARRHGDRLRAARVALTSGP